MKKDSSLNLCAYLLYACLGISSQIPTFLPSATKLFLAPILM